MTLTTAPQGPASSEPQGPASSEPQGPSTSRAPAPPSPRPVRRHRDVAGLLLRGWTVLVLVFLFLPILFVVAYSFNSGRRLVIWDGFGTNWYGTAVGNEVVTGSVTTSLVVAALTALLAVVLGALAGIALARRGGGWSAPFLAVVALVLVTPEIVDAIAYLVWFVRLGIADPYVRLVVGHSVYASAVVTLLVRARLQGLDESLEEAAADLGAPPLRAFRLVTLPLLMPALVAGGLLAFTTSLDNVVISAFVSTAGTTTLPVYVLSSLRTGLKGDLAAISVLMLAVTLLALVLAALVLRRGGASAEQVTGTLTGAG